MVEIWVKDQTFREPNSYCTWWITEANYQKFKLRYREHPNEDIYTSHYDCALHANCLFRMKKFQNITDFIIEIWYLQNVHHSNIV